MDKQKEEKEEIRILYVDDEEDARMVFFDILKYKGYEVDTAKDGYEAIEKVKKKSYSMILTDIKMPGLSGIDMFKEIREINPDLPVLMITGYPRMETAVELMKLGAFAYISKPIKLDELYREIEVALEKEKLIRKNKELFQNLQQVNKELEEANEKKVRERAKELEESQKKLLSLERLAATGQITVEIAHEIRNPLSVIANSAYLLSRIIRKEDVKLWENVKRIERAVEKASKFVDDLLNFSKPIMLEFQVISLNDILKDVFKKKSFNLQKVNVNTVFAPNLPGIKADSLHLKQAFESILNNSIKAMPNGGELTIHSIFNPESEFIEVEIRNTGIDILEEDIPFLFEPLYTIKSKKVGLDLAISKKIIEAHGGSIEVKAYPAKGIIFTVKLPVKRN